MMRGSTSRTPLPGWLYATSGALPISLPPLSDADDWRWQLRNRLTTKGELAARLALTPDELAQWRAAGESLKAKWAANAAKTGIGPEAAFKAFRAAIATYNAGF